MRPPRQWVSRLAYGVRASVGYSKPGASAPKGTVHMITALTESAGVHAGRHVTVTIPPDGIEDMIRVLETARRERDS